MRRVCHSPRSDWQSKVEKLGFLFHSPDQQTYWDESAHYEFEAAEVDLLEAATNELASRCLEVVEHVIAERRYTDLGISEHAVAAIEESWEQDQPSIYGRFDLAFDGATVKMLEYNADTPTSLLEAAVIQWHWLLDFDPDADQFNSIYEGLIQKWSQLKSEKDGLKSDLVHFACADWMEDLMTVAVLMDTAREAGLLTNHLWLDQIGWNPSSQRFVDLLNRPINTIFKLHPWEFLIADDFGHHALKPGSKTQWIEPAWKMILSNKGVLGLLWELFPNHPNLLAAFTDLPVGWKDYVRKPFLSREGANVEVVRDGVVLESSEGEYAHGREIFQALATLPSFDGQHPVIGSWVIDHCARGIGIRETPNLITSDLAHFVPHLFR